MFTSFSWKDFSISMVVLLALYYVALFLLYYRSELQQILSLASFSFGKLSFSGRPVSEDSDCNGVENDILPESTSPAKMDKSEPAEQFNELLEQIQQSIVHAAKEKMVKQELLWMIRSVLQQYHHLRNTDNIIAVNDFVIQLAEDQCAISLGQEDISPLWN